MSMAVELTLLAVLIVVFIFSFCGLLHKVRKSYEQERILAEREAQAQAQSRDSNISFTEVYINSVFVVDDGDQTNTDVLANGPPPYTEDYCGPPPKYEDIIKTNHPVPLAQVHVA